jgi:hypothetical protein
MPPSSEDIVITSRMTDKQFGQLRLGSIIGLLQMTANFEKGNIHFDGGVALGVSGLFIQIHLGLKCRPRHLRHPAGLPGWCLNSGSANRRDPRMITHLV